MVKRVQVFAVIEVPQHGLAVFAAASAEAAIWRHGHSIQVSGVSGMVDLEAAVGEVPHFDHAVPTRRNDDGV